MTHNEIIEMVSDVTGAPYDVACGFAQTFIDIVIESLDAGGEVKIRGLGTFKWVPVKGKSIPKGVRHPGEHVAVPDGKKLKFVPSKKFKSRRI